MNYERVDIKEKKVAGITVRTSNENMKCIEDMGKLWQRFQGEAVPGKIQGITGPVSYGVYHNYESDLTKPYDYTAAMEVASLDQSGEIQGRTIPAGNYAKFSGRGNMVEVVGQLWQQVWAADLQRSYSYDFEAYQMGETGPEDTLVEIFISLTN
ncbi:MAG: GyrI-like domain-containing protein [Spirochaetaceae bacterium]|jgi:predicted transcriptional regulator YdeE|nr:GyrI-like domain-containing protein [Spirochaetaceae bacterium]